MEIGWVTITPGGPPLMVTVETATVFPRGFSRSPGSLKVTA